jgi:hypothetical protein
MDISSLSLFHDSSAAPSNKALNATVGRGRPPAR